MNTMVYRFRKVINKVVFCLILLFILILALSSCSSKTDTQKIFVLNGVVDQGNEVLLGYLKLQGDDWVAVQDTAKIVNGKFQLKGEIDGLTSAYLTIDESLIISIYLEPTEIILDVSKDKLLDYTLTGTSVDFENKQLRNFMSFENQTIQSLQENIINLGNQMMDSEVDTDSLSLLQQKYLGDLQVEYVKRDSMKYDFILQNKNFKIIPDLLYQLTDKQVIAIDTIKKLSHNLITYADNRLMTQLLDKQIEWVENYKNVQEGGKVPNFVVEDLSGNDVNFRDLKQGHYILIDFWASWCGPCLQGLPLIQTLYDKYDNKGLQIISVSFDENVDEWKNAINKNDIGYWQHFRSVEYETNSVFSLQKVGEIYDVQYIPNYILIDKEGVIVGRWNHIGDKELRTIDQVIKETR